MALANQAALLDELMGVYRNSTDSKKVMRWSEDIVCKYYLAGFCPHELFVNTKEQLGPCPHHHDQNLLAKYKASSRYRRMGFEKQLQAYLEKFLQRRDSRIVTNRERINEAPLSGLEVKKMEIIAKNKTDIDEMIDRIESLANEGKIAESQVLFTQLEEKKNSLKYDEIELEKQKMANKIKEDDVCEVCGAMINRNDPRNSVDNHESGRIHCGYKEIDDVLISLKELTAEIELNEKNNRENAKFRLRDTKHRDLKVNSSERENGEEDVTIKKEGSVSDSVDNTSESMKRKHQSGTHVDSHHKRKKRHDERKRNEEYRNRKNKRRRSVDRH